VAASLCELALVNDGRLRAPGRLEFLRQTRSTADRPIRLRAVLRTPTAPWCRACLPTADPGRAPEQTLLVPTWPCCRIRATDSCMVANAENKVETRSIKIGRAHGPLRAVISGLTREDRVIVNGSDAVAAGRESCRSNSGVQSPKRKGGRQPTSRKPSSSREILHFFIRRRSFASVLSILFVLLGDRAVYAAIAQYPEIHAPDHLCHRPAIRRQRGHCRQCVATPLEEQSTGWRTCSTCRRNAAATASCGWQ